MAQHLGISSISDLQNLSQMLNPQQQNENDSDDDMIDTGNGSSGITPASIGRGVPKKIENDFAKSDPYAIWDVEEVPEVTAFADDGDPRPAPEYDISYKQKVTSEDMFLGMSGKNPSSACCEEIVVKIILPDTKMSDVNLDVKEKVLDCRTPKFKLVLALPHPVNPRNGKAKWNGDNSTLSVSLTMNREYDFINFQ